jgi:hypothetical protein
MHRLALLLLVSLSYLLAADSGLAGHYTGDWKSNGAGGGGTFSMKLESVSDGWKCEVGFTVSGADIKTTIRSCKVDQSKLEAVYDFELQGYALQSKITGRWNGKTFEGSYETTAGSDAVDDGSWTAAPAAGQ